jgi:hypothetical protein
MKKLIIALLLLFIGSAYAQDLKIVTKVIKDSSVAKMYWYSANYPQIDGMTDKQLQSKINDELLKTVKTCFDGFRKDMSDWEVPYELSEVNSFMEINFEPYVINEDVCSLALEVYTYYAGSAHPNSYTISNNWNIKTGKLITFKEMFKKNSNYLNKISAFCIGDLKLQAKINEFEFFDDMLKDGAGPKDSNFVNFNFLPKGLLITFDNYTVAPYVLGKQYVIIPYKTLSELMEEDCIMNKFYF